MNYSEIYKTLSSPEDWTVQSKGLYLEKYVHKHGATSFSGHHFVTFRSCGEVYEQGFLRYVYSRLMFKEHRFRKALKKLGRL